MVIIYGPLVFIYSVIRFRSNEPVAYILISVLFLYVPLDVKHEQNILYFKILTHRIVKQAKQKSSLQ